MDREELKDLRERCEGGDIDAARELIAEGELDADEACELGGFEEVDYDEDGEPGISDNAVGFSTDGYSEDATADEEHARRVGTYCDDMSCYVHDDYVYYIAGHGSISAGERESGDYVMCEDCCEDYHIDDVRRSRRDVYVCSGCWDDYEDGAGALMNYSADVLDEVGGFWVKGQRKSFAGKALVFGVELETQGSSADDIAEELMSNTSFGEFGICKEDGSVSGPECVTVPGDLWSHRNVYKWAEWTKALRDAGAHGHGSSEEAGIHIHINRRALGELTVAKLLYFINDGGNAAFIETIAQRSPGTYCKRNSCKLGKRINDNRYELVNITHATVEVRMFHANLRPERIMKNVEFCHALVSFLKSASLRDVEKRGAWNFCQWLRSNRKDYPELFAFMVERVRGFAESGDGLAQRALAA